MNIISRTITGLVIIALSIWFIFSVGFINESRIDYVSIVSGIFFLIIGIFIIFNKKEDSIEKIKK